MKRIVCLIPLLTVLVAHADTAFVTEHLTVDLKTDQGPAAATVKPLEAGAPLEVLERAGLWAHVRDRSGTEGWIESRFIASEPPARTQLARANDDLKKTRAQLADSQAQLKKTEADLQKSQADLAQASAKLKELQKNSANASPPPAIAPPVPMPSPAAAAPNLLKLSAEATKPNAGWAPVLIWLSACFAMLVIGFLSGAWWLRQSIRRRSGGMYLRV